MSSSCSSGTSSSTSSGTGSSTSSGTTTSTTTSTTTTTTFDRPANEREAQALEDMQEALSDEIVDISVHEWLRRRGTMLRYLRARDCDVAKALKMLMATAKWRVEVNPGSVVCSKCVANRMAHNMRCVGLDSLGRPVVYTCFRQAHDRWDPEVNMEHLISVMEATSEMMDRPIDGPNSSTDGAWERRDDYKPRCPSGKWVWFIDFEGYGLRDNSPKTTLLAARLLSHYPERLGLCLLFGAPWVFGASWRLVKPLLNKVTSDKVVFLGPGEVHKEDIHDAVAAVATSATSTAPAAKSSSNKPSAALKLAQTLHSNSWGVDLIEWMLHEVVENRTSGIADAKEYWLAPAPEKTADVNEEIGYVHDARGESSYVNSPLYAPPVPGT